jgi:hypothetical protein
VVTFAADFADPDEDEPDGSEKVPPPFTAKGSWHAPLSKVFREVRAQQIMDYYHDALPAPKFCPYCGTLLPEMRLKDPVPENVTRVLDGGYYCSTCHERLNECLCDPPSSAFEPVPNGG